MERAKLWWALAAAIALPVFILFYQLNYGALTGLIPWDDCAIVLRGLENLANVAQAHSPWNLLAAARRIDIHAPVSDIASIAGLLLAGGAVWGPYALNVIGLCVAIYALSTTAALKNPIVFAASVLFLLLQPITFSALAELKSDWQGGVLLAAGMFVLFDAAEENNDRGRILGAALLGLMLITKMTAFYLPVLAVGTFLAFELYGAVKCRQAKIDPSSHSEATCKSARTRFGGFVRLQSICGALILIPYLLFFYHSHGALLAYIRAALGPVWTDGLTASERLLYYVRGNLGTTTARCWIQAPLGAARNQLSGLPRGRLSRRSLEAQLVARAGMCWGSAIVAIFLTPLVLARTSNISFGAAFFGTLIGGVLIFMRIFVANAPRWGAVVAAIVVLALALPNALPLSPPRDLAGVPISRIEREHYQSIYDDMVGKIVNREGPERPKVVFTFEMFVAPSANLSIRFFQRTGRFLAVSRIDDLADVKSAASLADADFFITITPTGDARTVPNVGGNFPMSADPAMGDRRVRESGRYGLIAGYPISGGWSIRLYEAGARR